MLYLESGFAGHADPCFLLKISTLNTDCFHHCRVSVAVELVLARTQKARLAVANMLISSQTTLEELGGLHIMR
jgi:hypothetical protein